MKAIIPAALTPALLLGLTSCTTVCPTCQPLPARGTYSVCSVSGVAANHLQKEDKVIIGRIGNVTNVALVRGQTRTELQLFQGSRGLIGWATRKERVMHDNHVVSIAIAPSPPKGCDKGTDVIRIEFVEPDSEGAYSGGRSSPDYGHGHAQIE
jgi:hypothetical protein